MRLIPSTSRGQGKLRSTRAAAPTICSVRSSFSPISASSVFSVAMVPFSHGARCIDPVYGSLGSKPADSTAYRLPSTCIRAAARVLCKSMAIVSGPTPPGTGVICPATSRTASKSTSPTSPVSVRLMPTSITAAPGFTMSAVTNFGLPMATMRMSACRVSAGQILGAAVAHGDRRVTSPPALHEHDGDRLAHDVAPSQHHHVAARDGDLLAVEKFLDSVRCAGQESGSSLDNPADILRVERVHVFHRINRHQDRRFVDLLWERELHQNSVDRRIAVQLFHEGQQFGLGCFRRELVQPAGDPRFFARFLLVAHVDLAGGISPTRIAAKQGVTLRVAANSAASLAVSRRISSAIAFPSRIRALTITLLNVVLVACLASGIPILANHIEERKVPKRGRIPANNRTRRDRVVSNGQVFRQTIYAKAPSRKERRAKPW